MLEVGVEHDAGVPGAEIDAGGRRDFFAEISREVDVFDANIFFHDFFYLIVRLVITPIIDEDEFIGVFASERGENRPYLVIERADIFLLVIGRDDDGEGFHGVCFRIIKRSFRFLSGASAEWNHLGSSVLYPSFPTLSSFFIFDFNADEGDDEYDGEDDEEGRDGTDEEIFEEPGLVLRNPLIEFAEVLPKMVIAVDGAE